MSTVSAEWWCRSIRSWSMSATEARALGVGGRFCDRSGETICLDVPSRRLAWERHTSPPAPPSWLENHKNGDYASFPWRADDRKMVSGRQCRTRRICGKNPDRQDHHLGTAECSGLRCSSAQAVVGLTRQLAHELGPFGITVNSVAPGFIRSNPASEKQWAGYGEEGQRALLERIAMKRLGTAQDIANAVVFFASDLAGFINGQVLAVDGGK